jgi:hypothetical protein
MVTSTFIIRSVIHEDNYTETMDCIDYLLTSINSNDDAVPKMSLSRSIVTLSHYLAEVMFWSTVDNFVEKNKIILSTDVIEQVKPGTSLTLISLSKAIEEWPALLTNKGFDFDKEPFSSFKILIKYRNMLTHSNDYDIISYYLENYESASSAYYTAMKISEEIEKHFFPDKAFHYKIWYQTFPPPIEKTFQTAYNDAKKLAIPYNNVENQKRIDSICKNSNNYQAQDYILISDFLQTQSNDTNDIFNKVFQQCDLKIELHEKFINSLSTLDTSLFTNILYKIRKLLLNLNKRKIAGHFGIKFGEILPHTTLKIKRLKGDKWPGYMCMDHLNMLIIFKIDRESFKLIDLIKK